MAKTEATALPFKRKAAVSLPAMKEELGKPSYIRFDSETKVTVDIDPKTHSAKLNPDGSEKTTTTAIATDLLTGVQGTVVFRAAVLSQLQEYLGDAPMIGRCFEITKLPKREGKSYYDYSVFEIDPN